MNLSTTTLLARLGVDFTDQFPEDEFLTNELEKIIGGLTNSLRWAVYREATQGQVRNESLERRITTLDTIDHFSTSRMTRPEIIARICQTSGLTEEHSAFGLLTVEAIVDEALDIYGNVVVDLLGRVSRSEIHPNGYQIALADYMQLGPKAMYA